MPIHQTTLARSQSLRPCGAPAYASGPSVAARHLPTLWGVTLYTREALDRRRGEHCSPARSYGAAKLPGRTLFAPTDQHKYHPTPKTAAPNNPTGASRTPPPTTYSKAATNNRNLVPTNRRVLAPGRGQCVRSWVLRGALAKRSRKARTQAPLSRDCAVAKQSKPQWGFEAHERASSAGWRRSLCAAKRAPRK